MPHLAAQPHPVVLSRVASGHRPSRNLGCKAPAPVGCPEADPSAVGLESVAVVEPHEINVGNGSNLPLSETVNVGSGSGEPLTSRSAAPVPCRTRSSWRASA